MQITPAGMLRAIAGQDPTRTAVVTRDGVWSYGWLDQAVDKVSARLAATLVADRESRVVAVRARAGLTGLVCALAVSRVGMVCAAIDPSDPPARVRLVLDDLIGDGGPAVLIVDTDGDIAEFPDAIPFPRILDDDPAPAFIARGPVRLPQPDAFRPGALHTVAFTSGSAGVPTALCHTDYGRALGVRLEAVRAGRESMNVGVICAGSVTATVCAAVSGFECGRMVSFYDVLEDGTAGIADWMRDQRIQSVGLVPTLVRFLVPLWDSLLGPHGVLEDLDRVAVWGEGVDWSDLARLCRYLRPDAVVETVYGSTETDVVADLVITAGEIPVMAAAGGRVPAGRVWPDVELRIVDADGHDVPPGAQGELMVSGPRISLGYWHRPDRTRAAFRPDADGAAWFLVGDGGRSNPDGMLHVTGRLDGVVKVSGRRIELGEVERAARDQPAVAQAAATARTDADGFTRMHLYVVPRPGSVVDTRWLRVAMARSLPAAMLPDTIDILHDLPRLAGGKVDRRSLPAPSAVQATASDAEIAPLTRDVIGLLSHVLAVPVGPDDDFFAAGGDSLRAGRVVAALQDKLGRVIPPTLLIEAPTAAALAAALSTHQEATLVPVRTVGRDVPLFVVHGGAGDVMFARPLAAHLPDTPVYALQPPPLNGPHPFVGTLEEMADHYVTQIRRVWPDGPYRLFGYSMGGLIAFEMARRLADAGGRVTQLALGDTLAPGVAAAQRERARERRAHRPPTTVIAEDLRVRTRRVWRFVTGQTHRAAWRRYLDGAPPPTAARETAYLQVYGALAEAYRPSGVFTGPTVLFHAAREHAGTGAEAPPVDLGWSDHVGDLRQVSIDTDHQGLVREPALTELAAQIGRNNG